MYYFLHPHTPLCLELLDGIANCREGERGQHLARGVQQDNLGESPTPPTSKTVTRVLSLQLKLAPEPLRLLFVSLAPRFLHGGREVILSAAIFGELLIRKETLLAAS